MIGILVQLAVSWLIVWLYDKSDLSCLGLRPTKKRLSAFCIFIIVAAAFSAFGFLLKMLIANQSWQLNPELNTGLVLKGTWFVIKAVLFEELIFRGVLLYMLIRQLGATKAIIISSAAFGIYHWFSHELWGNPVQMAVEFFGAGAMGLVLAYGYAKTYSLYIPVAIHLGWNIIQMIVFPGNTIGEQVLVEVMPRPVVTISYFSYYTMQFLPLLFCVMIIAWMLRRQKQVSFKKRQV